MRETAEVEGSLGNSPWEQNVSHSPGKRGRGGDDKTGRRDWTANVIWPLGLGGV